MATKSGDVIFRAGEDTDASVIWDDTALIDAYDRAINAIKGGSKNEGKMKMGGKNRKQQSSKRKENKKKVEEQDFGFRWHVGDLCQAVFSEDELIYDAVIISIDSNSHTCVVRFSGYGNEEEQDLADILPPLSNRDSPRQDAMRVGSTNHLGGDNEMEWSSQSPMRWQISDLCLALELPSRHFHEAVINSFPTPYTCTVTFLRSGKRQAVAVSSLKPPHTSPCHHQHNVSSVHNSRHPTPGSQFLNYPGPSSFPSFMSFFPPPPPPPPLPQTLQHYWPTPGVQPSTATNTFPFAPMPPPPPPVSSSDVAHDNDALASMLMAWYLSGYHTGYYQAIQHLRQGSNTGTSERHVSTTETGAEGQHSSQLPKS